MMDVLIIIVIFLLKSYGLTIMQVPQQDKMELPKSKATEAFGDSIVLMITQDQILIDNESILKFEGDYKEKKFTLPATMPTPDASGKMQKVEDERGILAIYDILKRKKEEFDNLAARAPDPKEAAKKWTGDLLVQADKSVPYELMRKVMYTAGMAGYKQFRLTVEKKEE
jgi:biopolymer transport protein ExbD